MSHDELAAFTAQNDQLEQMVATVEANSQATANQAPAADVQAQVQRNEQLVQQIANAVGTAA